MVTENPVTDENEVEIYTKKTNNLRPLHHIQVDLGWPEKKNKSESKFGHFR